MPVYNTGRFKKLVVLASDGTPTELVATSFEPGQLSLPYAPTEASVYLHVGRQIDVTLAAFQATVAAPTLFASEVIVSVVAEPGASAALTYQGLWSNTLHFSSNSNNTDTTIRVLTVFQQA